MKAAAFFTLISLPFSLAAIGDTCAHEGLQGICQDIGNCTTSGFTVEDFCSNGVEDIICCVNDGGSGVGEGPNKPPSTGTPSSSPGELPEAPPPGGPGSIPRGQVSILFWIQAFLPHDIPAVTKPWPKDRSKTMIQGLPIIGDCFLTDQRSFSNTPGISSRMHSLADVTINPSRFTWSQNHWCTETVEVDCEDGDIEGRKTQTNENMSFKLRSGSTSKVVLDFKAARNNPLVRLSPDVDMNGVLTVDRVNKFVEFKGKVDDFPAFEAYVQINGGPIRTVALLGRKPGAGGSSMVGGANRAFSGRVRF